MTRFSVRFHMLKSKRRWLVAVASALTLVGTTRVNAFDVVGINGTLPKVPGYPPGTTLKYRVGAQKTGDSSGKTAHFWLKLFNPNAFEVRVVVCAMLTLKRPPVPGGSRAFKVVKNTAAEWECQSTGMSSQPPNVHFSCNRVTVPANGTIDVFDQAVTFSVSFEASELGAVYFDVLKDCPLNNCNQVKGADGWLVPLEPTGHADWVNIWASGKPYHDLVAGGFSAADWPSGNWVTMAFPDIYGARLSGIVTGAVAGSVIEFNFNGVPRQGYVVQRDPERPPCGGLSVAIDEFFTILPKEDPLDGMTLRMPDNQCGNVDEGSVVRFNSEVTAVEAPFYKRGEFMYGVDVFFVKDTEPPLIEAVRVQQVEPSSLRVDVTATDRTTMAIGATFVYSVEGQPTIEVPIDYADPASEDELMFFSDEFRDLPVGVPITYHVDVYDEVGNVASSPEETIELTFEKKTSR